MQFLLVGIPRWRRVAPAKEVMQYQGDAREFWQQAAKWTRTRGKITLISWGSMSLVSDIKLIRTDTTLDLSQKAEKGIMLPCILSFLYLAFAFVSSQSLWDQTLSSLLCSAIPSVWPFLTFWEGCYAVMWEVNVCWFSHLHSQMHFLFRRYLYNLNFQAFCMDSTLLTFCMLSINTGHSGSQWGN
jgi:hypothetical protein